ncbi:M56 family metallopeptidase [Sphingomonas sp.]|uniref:M56 family metallopeptidase n=1 Tax=Sphingomonas sp. TaxID=28214 RepID=UPI0035C8246B
MIALLLEALAGSTALMLLVLVARGPVRRAFGAEIAYLLWTLPVLRLMLPPLPSEWSPFGAAPMVGAGARAMTLIAPADPIAPVGVVAATSASVPIDAATMVTLAWASGALAILGVQLAQYLRFRARVLRGADVVARVGSIAVVESAGASGPLAFGLIRRVVAFPRDFAECYDVQERELALAHEIGHHRRGDLWANWVALAMLSLHWLNPVAWLAFRAFRADQEMANDAGVLAAVGAGQRHAYGCAIIKAAHGRALTPACHLNTVNDLKGRLRMLARGRVSGKRVAAGGAGVALLACAGLVLTASGMPAVARVRASVERVTGVRLATLDHDIAAGLTPAARTRTTRKVTIVENGRTIVLRDRDAAAYIAAHPVPTPPVPPMPVVPDGADWPPTPPTPPTPPIPPAVPSVPARSLSMSDAEAVAASREARQEAAATAREARREAMEAAREGRQDAMEASREAQRARQEAMREAHASLRSAMASLATTRAELAADRALSGSDRAGALREVDAALANVKAQMAAID